MGRPIAIFLAAAAVVRSIEGVGPRPWGLARSPAGDKLFTANGPSDDVSIVDVATGKVIRRIPAGGSPWGIAVGASTAP